MGDEVMINCYEDSEFVNIADLSFVESVINGIRNVYDKRNENIALLIAVKNGWFDKTKQLIDKDENQLHYVREYENRGIKSKENAIFLAIVHSHFEILELLISRGADVNFDPEMTECITCLAKDNLPDERYFKLLVKSGIKINEIRHGFVHSALLHHFTYHRNIEMLNFLLDNGADVKFKNHKGHTAVFIAIVENCHQVLAVLLQRISHEELQATYLLPMWTNYGQYSIFNYAICFSSLEIVKLLWPFMEEKDKLTVCDNPQTEMCFLHSAISCGQSVEVLKFLLENGLQVNACVTSRRKLNALADHDFYGEGLSNVENFGYPNSEFNWSLLGCAVFGRVYENVCFLIENGAEVNPSSEDTVHPLYIACLVGDVAICRLLLSKKSNPNFRVKIGTEMRAVNLVAACTVLSGCLLELLIAGADLNLLSKPFLEFLQRSGKYELVWTLRKAFINQTLDIPSRY